MNIRLQDIERLHLVLAAGLCAVALLTGALDLMGVASGAAVMAANVWLMRQLFGRLFRPDISKGLVLALASLKFFLFLGLLAFLFVRAPFDPLAFGIGATLLPVSCLLVALRRPADAPLPSA